ncbi:hypothetical protein Leryth_019439 [Lithospermum erythrorhizon]|nr:hypothetical protein Leryth_019439 [Lithospermum erythrorhizon]
MFSLLKLAWQCIILDQELILNLDKFIQAEDIPELRVTRFESKSKGSIDDDSIECAVCLCKIKDGDEIREIACDHIFHRVCLDKWLIDRARITCPLCRKYVKLQHSGVMDDQLKEKFIVFNFGRGRRSNDDDCKWWLR